MDIGAQIRRGNHREILTLAVMNFGTDRRAAITIRWISENLVDLFIDDGIDILLKLDNAPGIRYLALQLIKHPNFFLALTDPWRYTVKQAVKLGRRMLEVDRTLDVRLARCLPGRNGHVGDCVLTGQMAERALEILDEISIGRRVVPVLNHLTRYPDVRISSKTTLLVGKRVQSINWVRRLIRSDVDPRVRANAIEAFWGSDSRAALHVFRASLKDSHNRVVGNSIMGLHFAGDTEVPRLVERFASDENPNFRMTTAWTMGKIGYPEFAEPLNWLVRDNNPSVRSAALRALMELRRLEYREPEKAVEPDPVAEETRLAPFVDTPPHVEAEAEPDVTPVSLWIDGTRESYDRRRAPIRRRLIW